MASKKEMIKLLTDQIKEIRVDIASIDKGEAAEKDRPRLMKLLDEKKNKLKELEMDKKAKGVDTKDMTTLKNLKEDKKEEQKKKDEELKKKVPKGYGIASKASEELPTTKSLWEEKKDVEKRDPFKYVKTEKKKAALEILKNAGFSLKAENLATLNSQAVEHLSQAATALQSLHNTLATAKGDDQKVVEWQKDIETLLQIIQKWRSEFPSRVKDFLRNAAY